MKSLSLISVVCGVVLLISISSCDDASANIENLLEISAHGHDTGLANKGKRCPIPLRLPFYDHLLGSVHHNPINQSPFMHLQSRREPSASASVSACDNCKKLFCPATIKQNDKKCHFCIPLCDFSSKRSATDTKDADNEDKIIQLSSRFNKPDGDVSKSDEDINSGLSETQERYYTVGSFGAGLQQTVLSKLLNIPESVQLERLIVLAKNKSKIKPAAIPHPVVIDTAHVFTRNDGTPTSLDLELHGVKGNRPEDISNLTSQLNKELDAAIDTKKHMLGDSHLTPVEIDKIIAHVVEQMNKKAASKPVEKETLPTVADKATELKSEPIAKDKNNQQEIVSATHDEKHVLPDKSLPASVEEALLELEQPEFDAIDNNDDFVLEKKKFKKKGKKFFRDNNDNAEEDQSEDDSTIVGAPQDGEVEFPEDPNLRYSRPSYSFHGQQIHKPNHGHHANGNHQKYGENRPLYEDHHEKPEQEEEAPMNPYGNIGHHAYGEHRPMYEDHHGGYQGHEEHEKPEELDHEGPAAKPYSNNGHHGYGNHQNYGEHRPMYEDHEEGPAVNPYNQHQEEAQDHSGMDQERPEHGAEHDTYHGSQSYQRPQSDNHYVAPHMNPIYHDKNEDHAPQEQHLPSYNPYGPHDSHDSPHASYGPYDHGPMASDHNQNDERPGFEENEEPEEHGQAAYGSPLYRTQAQEAEAPVKPEEPFKEEKVSLLGAPQDMPEDPALKANWFENEYHRLRQWIADNAGSIPTPSSDAQPKAEIDPKEEKALVNEFTKVIEQDLADGKKLSPMEKDVIDKKISQMVRENIDTENPEGTEAKTRNNLDEIEDKIDEVDENKMSDNVGSPMATMIDNLKSRLASQDRPEAPMKAVENLKNKLRSSLENLRKDKAAVDQKFRQAANANEQLTIKPMVLFPSAPEVTEDPLVPVHNVRKLPPGSGFPTIPRLGQRLNTLDSTDPAAVKDVPEAATKDETLGTFKHDKSREESGEWTMDGPYHHQQKGYNSGNGGNDVGEDNGGEGGEGGYGGSAYRTADEKTPIDDAVGKARSSEDFMNNVPTLPELLENLQDSLNLPPLEPLPNLPNLRQHRPQHQHQGPPMIHLNGQPMRPDMNRRPIPVLPEMPQQFPPNFRPQFAQQQPQMPNFQRFPPRPEFPQRPMNQHMNGPMHRPMNQFVGAIESQQSQSQPQFAQDLDTISTHFGKIIPEAIHEAQQQQFEQDQQQQQRQKRDLAQELKHHRMYFVGDGIRLPLHMQKQADGSLHLSVDLQKLCACNTTGCNNASATKVSSGPDFLSTNLLGSKPSNDDETRHEEELKNNDDNASIDIADVPLQLANPFMGRNIFGFNKKIVRRSPRFNYYNNQPSTAQEETQTGIKRAEVNYVGDTINDDRDNEKFDLLTPITREKVNRIQEKVDAFNHDMKEYYANEEKIAEGRSEHLPNLDLEEMIGKRISLLTSILGWMKDIVVEEPDLIRF